MGTRIKLSFILFLMVSSIGSGSIFSQSSSDSVNAVDGEDSKKEEIQRYIGYEDLLYRYLSLPYDSTMNINESGSFVDIGYLYLMFLPLFFLLLMSKRSMALTIITATLMLIMLIVSTSNSYVLDADANRVYKTKDGTFQQQKDFSYQKAPVDALVYDIYKVTNKLYTPFRSISSWVSGQKDHFTYPFLMLLFILTGYWLFQYLNDHRSNTLVTVAFLFFNYSFFWLVLSSGIIWYGFLMLCLGAVFLVLLLKKLKKSGSWHYRWANFSFIAMTSIWIIMSFVMRISNVSASTQQQQYGMGMFHPVLFDYNTGVKSDQEVMDRIYPGLFGTLELINRDKKSLIYRAGTSLGYFFENNHLRVKQDNQLGFFNRLLETYPDKIELSKALKASGFKYLIIDLNTVTIDKTENRTLTQKYNAFMSYIYENPTVRVINTNRVVKISDPNTGQINNYYGIFGEILFGGSYAILELI